MIALGVWLIPLPLGVALYTLTAVRTELRELAVPAFWRLWRSAIAVLASGGLEFGAAAARVVFLIAAASARREHRLAARLRPRDRGEGRARSSGSRRPSAPRRRRGAGTHRARTARRRRARPERDRRPGGRRRRRLRARTGRREGADPRRRQRRPRRARRPPPRTRRPALDGPTTSRRPGLGADRRLVETRARHGPRRLGRGRGQATRAAGSVDLSAYRIVQEALTNSLKHATGRARRGPHPVRRDARSSTCVTTGAASERRRRSRAAG